MALLVLTVYQWERAEFGKLRHKCRVLYLYKPVQLSPCRGAALSPRGSNHSSKGGSKSGMGGQSLGAWLEAVHSCLVLVVVLASQTGLSTPKEARRQTGRVLCSQKGTCKRSSVGSILKHPARSLTQTGVLFLKTVDK